MKRVLLTVAALFCILTLVACGASVKMQNDAYVGEEAIEIVDRNGNIHYGIPRA